MSKYILSKYNVFKPINNTMVGVNLINKVLFAVDMEKYDILKENEHNLDKVKDEHSTLFSAMSKLGVIKDKETDDNQPKNLLLKNRLIVFADKAYKLIINPTLNCNFSCWYCYEDHTKKHMTKKYIKATIKYIEHLVCDQKIYHLELGWFGGEPLLCYNTVMKPIALAAKELCDKHGVSFQSEITTNGYLLKPEMVTFLKEINLQSIQITLDGEKELHDKIRFNKDKKPTYDKIVQNISLLASKLRPNNLALRINFTQETFKGIHKIIDSFPESVRSNITVLLQQVWQDKDNSKSSIVELETTKLKFEKAGFKVDKNILNIKCYSCYADLFYQALINYDGRVFKCTARNFEKEKEDGILTEDGEIIWSNSLSQKTSNATFESEKCLACKYLPVCPGPCSQKMSNVKESKDIDKFCYELGIEDTLNYIMNEFEKTEVALAPLLDYR